VDQNELANVLIVMFYVILTRSIRLILYFSVSRERSEFVFEFEVLPARASAAPRKHRDEDDAERFRSKPRTVSVDSKTAPASIVRSINDEELILVRGNKYVKKVRKCRSKSDPDPAEQFQQPWQLQYGV
jgi:hypothetical protein